MFSKRDWVTLGLITLAQVGLVMCYFGLQPRFYQPKLASGLVDPRKDNHLPLPQSKIDPLPQTPPSMPGVVQPASFDMPPPEPILPVAQPDMKANWSAPEADLDKKGSTPPVVELSPPMPIVPPAPLAPAAGSPVEITPQTPKPIDNGPPVPMMPVDKILEQPPAPTPPGPPAPAPLAPPSAADKYVKEIGPLVTAPAGPEPGTVPNAVPPASGIAPVNPPQPTPLTPTVPPVSPPVWPDHSGSPVPPSAPVVPPTGPGTAPPEIGLTPIMPPVDLHRGPSRPTLGQVGMVKTESPAIPPACAKEGNPDASPWHFQVAIIDQRTVLTAKTDKGATFVIRCASLKLNRPDGNVEASGKVEIEGNALQASCDKLTINWSEDRLQLNGNAHLLRTSNGEKIELNGPTLHFHMSTLQPAVKTKVVPAAW